MASRISYEQSREDHDYLWAIAPAYDMTGGYVDQEDLARMLSKPSKATARTCLCDQIAYWFHVGPDLTGRPNPQGIDWSDPMIREIAERHFCLPEGMEVDDED